MTVAGSRARGWPFQAFSKRGLLLRWRSYISGSGANDQAFPETRVASVENDTQVLHTSGLARSTPPPTSLRPQWCAVYVIARHEKAVADHMTCRSLESFLPLYRSVRTWKNRRAKIELPLFPSYLFIRISMAERVSALQVPGVVHIVSFHGLPVTVPDDQIETLRRALQMRGSEPHTYLTSGRRVRIKAGPLQGLEGVVVRHNSQTRIIVSVDFIQRSTSVELWPEDLECMPDIISRQPGTSASR